MDTAIIYLSYRICTQRLVIKETGEVYEFHSEAMEFKNQGKPLVGAFCTYLPMELALAAGAAATLTCVNR